MRSSARQDENAYYDAGADWAKVRRAESQYAAQLRQIATHIGTLVRGFDLNDPQQLADLQRVLENYSVILEPWARAAAGRMIGEVLRRDQLAWTRLSRRIGRALVEEIENTPLGGVAQELLYSQVELIKSLPRQAAERAQRLAMQAITGGQRYSEVREEILRTESVTRSRAETIARTEVGKASASIVQARAQFVGATHYTWQTSMDRDVRPAHRKLQGKVFAWTDPPVAEAGGQRHHPGQFVNCRCWAAPIITQ